MYLSDCCTPSGYDRFFNSRFANRSLKRFRKKGLDRLERTVVDGMADVNNATVLEIGGGLGHLQMELLKAGASHSTNVELSPSYEEAAGSLASELGYSDRVDRHLGDFVIVQGDIPNADAVILNRVVCCYPHMERLVGAAASKTNHRLGLIFPRDEWWPRMWLGIGNFFMQFRDSEFRVFVHSLDDLSAVAAKAGLKEIISEQNTVWRAVVYERSAA